MIKVKRIFAVAAACLAAVCCISFGAISKSFAANDESSYDFKMINGASVRTDGEVALRFVTRLKRSDLETVLSKKSVEQSDVKIVTMITPADYLEAKGLTEFTRENVYYPDDENKDAVNDVLAQNVEMTADKFVTKAENIHESDSSVNTDDYYYYNAVLYNVSEKNIAREFAARSYLEVNGEILCYTAFDLQNNSRSVWAVADAAIKDPNRDFDENSDAYKNVAALCKTSEITVKSNLAVKVGSDTYEKDDYFAAQTFTVKRGQNLTSVLKEIQHEGYAYSPKLYDAEGSEIDATKIVEKDATITAKFTNAVVFELNTQEDGYTIVSHGNVASYTAKIKIPAEFNGKPVTAIAGNAFNANTHAALQNVTVMDLGDTPITAIGGDGNTNIFFDMTGLKHIVVPKSLTTIGRKVFELKSGSNLDAVICVNGDSVNHQLTISNDKNAGMEKATVYYLGTGNDCETWHYDLNGEVITNDHKFEDGICSVCGGYQTESLQYTLFDGFVGYVLTATGGASEVHVAKEYNDGTNGTKPVIGVHVSAFNKNTTVEKIYFPSSIKYVVGEKADSTKQDSLFLSCTKLTYIKLSPNMDIDYCYDSATGEKISTNTMPNTFYNDDKITIVIPQVVSGDKFNFARKSFYGTVGYITICYEGTDPSDIVVPNDGNNSTDHYGIYTYSKTPKANTWRYVDGVATVWTEEEIAANA